MGCCGKNRPVARFAQVDETPRVTFTPPATVSAEYFEYVGKTSLTAVGPVTRRRYRFAAPGAVVEVDGYDAPGMAGVPNLRRIKSGATG
jgi:hypothetical protein